MKTINLPEDVVDTLLAHSTLALEPMVTEPNYRIPEMRLDVHVPMPMLEREARAGVAL